MSARERVAVRVLPDSADVSQAVADEIAQLVRSTGQSGEADPSA